MIKTYYLPLFLLIFIASCKKNNQSDTDKVSVEIMHYRRGDLIKTELTDLTTRLTNGSTLQLLGVQKNASGETIIDPSIEIYNNDISKIKINGYTSDLIADKNFMIDDINYNIKKYYYNIPDIFDEESYIFLHNNKMICLSSKTWNSFMFYKYDEIDFYQILLNDNDNFFNRGKKKPTHNKGYN